MKPKCRAKLRLKKCVGPRLQTETVSDVACELPWGHPGMHRYPWNTVNGTIEVVAWFRDRGSAKTSAKTWRQLLQTAMPGWHT